MLQSIHVKNLALIEETEVEFTPGLNIVTGETGAGKSLLIGSVNLALGGKFDTDMLRTGADSGLVELVFTESDRVKAKLLELDLPMSEDGTVILTRRLSPTKSSCKINGETVTAKQVRELAEELIDIHGQHDHQSLLKNSKHLEILDEFGGDAIAEKISLVKVAYDNWFKLKEELMSEKKDTKAMDREISLLEFEANEIEAALLVEGEDSDLEEKYKLISNSKKILEALGETYELTGANGVAHAVGQAIKSISNVSDFDSKLNNLYEELSQMEDMLNDFNREISSYLSDYDFSNEEFLQTEERLDLINNLKNKYGKTISDVIAYGENARKTLEKYADYDAYISKLESDTNKAYDYLLKECSELTALRTKEAVKLSKLLKESLENLNFLTVDFSIEINPAENVGPKGFDEAQFMISTNPGEALKPLSNVASGGELSRIMLGIKTVMADKDNIEALIFDEIDTGISGKTAWKVSKQLGQLSKSHQILCITHLPQIAAMANTHFVIEKDADDKGTHTKVRLLDDEESVQELARLLGSDEQSQAALENARDMKKKAGEALF